MRTAMEPAGDDLPPPVDAESARSATARSGGGGGRRRGVHRRRPTAPVASLSPLRHTILEVGLALITAGVVVLLFVAYQLWGTGFAQRRSQHQLAKTFKAPVSAPAPVPTPSPSPPAPAPPGGEAIAHLVIPRIGVDQYIVEGITTNQLRKGPGHYPQTALPGDPGNAAIAGHRTTYGAPFYRLNELQPGDPILVTTSTGQFRYTVSDSKVVKPTDVSVLDPTPDDRLTLTTCNPRFSASTRLIVVGRLDNPPAPTAVSAGPTLPPTPRNLGSGDRSAWPHVILYGAITLLLWVAVRLAGARSRGGRRWAVWVLGIPLCLVPLWFVFENVVRLLPSNI